MRKKLFALLAVLAFSMALHAEGRILTFLWDWDDFDVVAFRYQLDSEEEGGWTECGWDQTSASFEDLDLSRPHLLYLQQSYDGINWSPSSVLAAAPPQEETLLADEPPAETEEPPAPAPAPPQEIKAERRPLRWNLGLAAGTKGALAIGGPRAAQIGLSFVLEEIHSFSEVFALAFETDLLCDLAISSPSSLEGASLSSLIVLCAKLSPKLALNLPAGIEIVGDFGKPSFRLGAGFDIGLGIGFFFSDRFLASAKGLFHLAAAGSSFSAGAAVGLRF